MRYNRILHRIAALLLGGLVLGSCIYDHLDDGEPEIESPFTDGYSINVMLTLDNMGGTRATPEEFRTFENYIDPEKCRVLFFDKDGYFLFESKSRWVKQLTAGGEESWLVSVPMYAYGNDVAERWRWQQIRKVMMEEEDAKGVSFKIAILVNRPAVEVYPDLETEDKDGDVQRGATTFDNSGPHWDVKDTRFGDGFDPTLGRNPSCKTIYDLHHTQADPIYNDKGHPTNGNNKWTDNNFYLPFIGEQQMPNNEGKMLDVMSSTSSWVDYGPTNADDSPRTLIDKNNGRSKRRAARAPDTNYPIPMYGVQNFGKIENWVDGVPFNLSKFTNSNDPGKDYEYKSIALLRSVVKLELVVPKTAFNSNAARTPDFVALAYSNIYARSEPMDCWTPTEKIWKDGAKHENRNQNNLEEGNCEWFTIQKYSRLVQNNAGVPTDAALNTADDKEANNPKVKQNLHAYRRRLAWFYGAWLDNPNWNFTGLYDTNDGTYNRGHTSGRDVVQAIVDERRALGDFPPRIFNPCIQRNNYVIVDEENRYDDGTNWHYIVYTGERNGIDPNAIYNIDVKTSIAPTVCFWMLAVNGRMYAIPITKYEGNTVVTNDCLSRYLSYTGTYPGSAALSNPPAMSSNNSGSSYPQLMVESTTTNLDLLPWPLMRNHHYTITIGGVRADDGELTISSDVKCSETLERNPAPAPAPEKPAKE